MCEDKCSKCGMSHIFCDCSGEEYFGETEDCDETDRQLDWALTWLAYYKAQADGVYADPSATPTTVEQLRAQSKGGGMPR